MATMKSIFQLKNLTTEDLQWQVYILCGILSIFVVIFIVISTAGLCVAFGLKKRLNKLETEQFEASSEFRIERVKLPYCYKNPTIQPYEELSRRGYSMYDGGDSVTSLNKSKGSRSNFSTARSDSTGRVNGLRNNNFKF